MPGLSRPRKPIAMASSECGLRKSRSTDAQGRVTHLTQHVSSSEFVTIFEVVFPGGKFAYRETDLDRNGKPVGKDQAKKLASVKLKDLQSLKVDAKAEVQLVPKITLYAVTDAGLIQAIDGETGRTRWKTSVGNPRIQPRRSEPTINLSSPSTVPMY